MKIKLLIFFLLVSIKLSSQVQLIKDVAEYNLYNIGSSASGWSTFFQNGSIFFAGQNADYNKYIFKTDSTGNNVEPILSISSNYNNVKVFKLNENDTIFYIYVDSKIYKSDGTSAGTKEIHGLNVPLQYTVFNNKLYYLGEHPSFPGLNLIQSDCTVEGTFPITMFTDFTCLYSDRKIEVFQDKIYFLRQISSNCSFNQLWKSDGTASGTSLFYGQSNVSNIRHQHETNSFSSSLFFVANSIFGTERMFKTDGTVAGTGILNDLITIDPIDPVYYDFYKLPNVDLVKVSGSQLGLYRTDGTLNGTVFLTNFDQSVNPIVLGNELIFAKSSSQGIELWKTDGYTVSLIKDINPNGSSSPKHFTRLGNKVVFIAKKSDIIGEELYETDGTTIGTKLIKNVNSSNFGNIEVHIIVSPPNNNYVIFGAKTNTSYNLWISFGDSISTKRLEYVFKSKNSIRVKKSIKFNNKVYFIAENMNTHNEGLYVSDGTESGTFILSNNIDAIRDLCVYKNSLYFIGRNYPNGKEVYKYDDMNNQITLLKDINGDDDFGPTNLIVFKDELFFCNSSYSSSRNGLWKSNGTTAGTSLVKGIVNNNYGNSILYSSEENLFFSNNGIWISDGTHSGTYNLMPYNSYPYNNSNFSVFQKDSTEYYFLDKRIYKRDLNSNSIQFLHSLPGVCSSRQRHGNTIYFQLNESGLLSNYHSLIMSFNMLNDELTEIKDLGLNEIPVEKSFQIFNDRIYYLDSISTWDYELFSFEINNPQNSILVKDINPGEKGTQISSWRVIDGTLYFVATNDQYGKELWSTQGSACNTNIIADISPGYTFSNPVILEKINDKIIVNAFLDTIGKELWYFNDNKFTIDTACYSYTWSVNNQIYVESGLYYHTLTSVSGCDSIVGLDITIVKPSDTITVSSCNNYYWDDAQVFLDSSGFYTSEVEILNGCITDRTLNLTVTDVFKDTLYVTACGNYFWNRKSLTYSQSGVYSVNYPSFTDCDSTYYLNLTINPKYLFNTTVSICQSSYYWPQKQEILYQSGIYYDSLTSINGCDSIIKLTLFLNPIQGEINYVLNCNYSYVWPLNGQQYFGSASDQIILTTSEGCDSIVFLQLDYSPTLEMDYIYSCKPYFWPQTGQIYTQNGIYTDTIFGTSNCDSIYMIEFIYQPIVEYQDIYSCSSTFVWPVNGQVYQVSNSYTYLDTTGACDKIYNFYGIYNAAYVEDQYNSSCSGYTWPVNNVTYFESGYYSQSFVTLDGCDSVINLHFDYFGEILTDTIYTCSSFLWGVNNQSYFNSGEYYANFTNQYGCDSIHKLILNLTPESIVVDSISTCNAFHWDKNFATYNQSGTYYHATSGINCDTIFKLVLTINPIELDTIYVQSCQPYFWTTSGDIYSSSGVYTYLMDNNTNCDSLFVLSYTKIPAFVDTIEAVSCDNFVWNLNGQSYSQSGLYNHTISSQGCDSTYFLVLDIWNTNDTIYLNSCEEYFWNLTGETYNESGVYSFLTQSVLGCDSLIILDLEINFSTNSSIYDTACQSYTWSLNNQVYQSSGIYQHTLQSQNGCDSIVNLNLHIVNQISSQLEFFVYPSSSENNCDGKISFFPSGNAPFEIDFNGVNYSEVTSDLLISDLCPEVSILTLISSCDISSEYTIFMTSNENSIHPNLSLTENYIELPATRIDCYLQQSNIDTAYIFQSQVSGNLIIVIWKVVFEDGFTKDFIVNYSYTGLSSKYLLQLKLYCNDLNYFTVTQVIEIENDQILLLDMNKFERSIDIYPNPTRNIVFIKEKFDSDVDIEVFDLKGKLLYVERINQETEIDLRYFEDGVYIFKLSTNDFVMNKRIIKVGN